MLSSSRWRDLSSCPVNFDRGPGLSSPHTLIAPGRAPTCQQPPFSPTHQAAPHNRDKQVDTRSRLETGLRV
ncbi:hypothetical protein RRG08_042687 [Elysia crispata]|uniref:Uncharacterized protein n=1 Tax=Elysia crispata TaxID=231223 RepID=A0AAE1CK56_9GAST|nr:hypothetical protein RRG08_042687 [Elysia crispata]